MNTLPLLTWVWPLLFGKSCFSPWGSRSRSSAWTPWIKEWVCVCVCVHANGPFSAPVCGVAVCPRRNRQWSVWVQKSTRDIINSCLLTLILSSTLKEGSSFEIETNQIPPHGHNPCFSLTNTRNNSLLEWHFYCSFPLVPFLEFRFLQQQEWDNRPDTLKTDTAGLDLSGYTPEMLVPVCVVHCGYGHKLLSFLVLWWAGS